MTTDTDTIRALANAATSGVWTPGEDGFATGPVFTHCCSPLSAQDRADLDYVAAVAPSKLLPLLDELDATREKITALVDLAAQIPVSADEGRWIRQQLFTILGAQLSTAICPDCRDGKHGACIGEAWDADKDEITSCKCAHTAAEAGQ